MTKMTRKEALMFAVECVEERKGDIMLQKLERFSSEEDVNYWNEFIKDCQEALEVLDKMIKQIDKQASRPKAKTSARIQNEKYAVLFIAALRAADKPVNATWIAEHVNGVLTSQRGTHVAKIALEWGAIREVTIKKRTFYEAVPDWEGCEEFAEVAKKLRRQ